MEKNKNLKNQKAFTLIELLVVVAVLGILAATAGGMYTNYMIRAKTAEAPGMINKMIEGQAALAASERPMTEAGPTNVPPPGTKMRVDFAADPRWATIGFGVNDPIYFGYQAVSTASNSIDCEALGDFDTDGVLSTFRRTITNVDGRTMLSGLKIFDELE